MQRVRWYKQAEYSYFVKGYTPILRVVYKFASFFCTKPRLYVSSTSASVLDRCIQTNLQLAQSITLRGPENHPLGAILHTLTIPIKDIQILEW